MRRGPSPRDPVEYVDLPPDQRWAYLRRFYDVASAFYGAKDKVLDDAKVDGCLRAFKEKPASRVRSRLDLRAWRFRVDDEDEGIRAGWYGEGHAEAGWEAVQLPHSVNHVPKDPVRFGRTRYRILAPEPGTSWDIWKGDSVTWYRTRVAVPPLGAGRVAHLGFDSVNLVADVWVNEAPVMMSHLGLFPFSMEITEELEARGGTDAVVALRVTNHATNMPNLFANGAQVSYAQPPHTKHPFAIDARDQAWSGIAGGARLDIMDRRHIQDVFLRTEKITGTRADVTCRVELRNEGWERFAGTVRVQITEWLPTEGDLREAARASVDVLPLNDGVFTAPFTVTDPRPWSPESPSLYLAHVVLLDAAGNELDDVFQTFGLRTITVKDSHFFLNGTRILPRGTHNMTAYPDDSLVCPSDRSIVRDILLHKEMNATCSRWPSDIRMHYGRIADWADQLGYLISWAGYFEMWVTHPEMEMYGERDVRALVRSLRNHPSIIVWEMGDEPLMEVHPHRRFRWYEHMYDMVAAEDTSRPIIPAGFWCNELVDLVEKHPASNLSPAERRRQVLNDYPLFTRGLSVWDYHYCPYLPTNPMAPTWKYVDMVRRSLEGQRATVFTEFGMDGMPRFENVADYYGTFRWASWGLMPVSRAASDRNYYGRDVGQDDWRETQAAQAITISGIIEQLRAHPEAFAAYYSVTFIDPWTFYWGVVDARWNAKLAFFVLRAYNAPVLLSGLHGTTRIDRAAGGLTLTASNIGADLRGVTLAARVVDSAGAAAATGTFTSPVIPGSGAVTELGRMDVGALPPGMYSLELRLTCAGREAAATVELFILG